MAIQVKRSMIDVKEIQMGSEGRATAKPASLTTGSCSAAGRVRSDPDDQKVVNHFDYETEEESETGRADHPQRTAEQCSQSQERVQLADNLPVRHKPWVHSLVNLLNRKAGTFIPGLSYLTSSQLLPRGRLSLRRIATDARLGRSSSQSSSASNASRTLSQPRRTAS